MRRKALKFNQAGDTIIEVMAAITVLGLALSAAYGLSNRAFRTAQHSHDRVEALALAQGQVEFLRDRGLKGQINSLILANPGPFCFIDSGPYANQTRDASNDFCQTYGPGQASIYDIAITYCDASAGCSPGNVFTVKASWLAGGSGQQNQLTIYYKPQR